MQHTLTGTLPMTDVASPSTGPLVALACAFALCACGAEDRRPVGQPSTTADTSATADAFDGGSADTGSSGQDAGGAAGQDTAGSDARWSTDSGAATRADTGSSTDAGAGADTADTDTDTAGTDTADTADTGTGKDAGSPGDAAGTNQGKHLWGPKHCKKAGNGVGYDVGQQLGDLTVTDCDTGAKRSIQEICGADATWLFVAHSHCPTCRATATYTNKLAGELADLNIAVVHVVQIDDAQTCQSWRKKYALAGLPNVRVYQENTGAAWQAIKTKNYTAPHAIMGPDRVITFKAHGLSAGAVKAKLLAAMKPAKP